MNLFEKIYSIFAILVIFLFIFLAATTPELPDLKVLILLTTIPFFLTIGLLSVVFKDIYFREFPSQNHKFIWFILILFILPSIIVYLPLHGFKKR